MSRSASRALLAFFAIASGTAGCQTLLDFTASAPEPGGDDGSSAPHPSDAATDADADTSSVVVEVFANVHAAPHLLAMNANHLYVVGDDQQIMRVDKISRAVEPQGTPASGVHGGALTFNALVADDRSLFLVAHEDHACGSPDTAWRSPVGNAGSFILVGSYCASLTALARDAVDFTYTGSPNLGGTQLWRVAQSSTTGPATVIANGLPAISAMVSTVDDVYVLSDATKQILKVSKTSDAGVDFALAKSNPKAIVADEHDVYWIEADGRVARKARTASASDPAVDVARAASGVLSLADDADHLYFTNVASGTVETVPKTGGAPVLIADHQAEPLAIAADEAAVYWLNRGDGTLMRATRRRTP